MPIIHRNLPLKIIAICSNKEQASVFFLKSIYWSIFSDLFPCDNSVNAATPDPTKSCVPNTRSNRSFSVNVIDTKRKKRALSARTTNGKTNAIFLRCERNRRKLNEPWREHQRRLNSSGSIDQPCCFRFVSRRLKEPPSPPVPPVDLLLHRERKKRSFCNQDTVHRTCERSRIGQCSWHAPPWLRFTPFDREIESAKPNFQVFQPREIIQWIRNFCSFATSEVDSRANLALRESVEKPTVKDWERIAVRRWKF